MSPQVWKEILLDPVLVPLCIFLCSPEYSLVFPYHNTYLFVDNGFNGNNLWLRGAHRRFIGEGS